MAREFAKAFYKSKAWIQCRASYISYVHGLCERCNSSGKIVPGLILHHKIKLTPSNINDPMIALNHEHLEYLCLECHNITHSNNKEHAIAEGLLFTTDGDIVALPPL